MKISQVRFLSFVKLLSSAKWESSSDVNELMTFVDGRSKSLEYLNFLFISRKKKTAFSEAFRVSNSKERYASETDLRRGKKYLSRRVANKLLCKVIVFFLLL